MAELTPGQILKELVCSRYVYDPGVGGTREILTEQEVQERKIPATQLSQHLAQATYGLNKTGIVEMVAEKMGVHHPDVSMYFSGAQDIPYKRLGALADALKLSTEERFRLYESVIEPEKKPELKDALPVKNALHLIQDGLEKRDVFRGIASACCETANGEVVPWKTLHQTARQANDPDLMLGHTPLSVKRTEEIYERYIGGARDGTLLPLEPKHYVLLEAIDVIPREAKSTAQLRQPENFFTPEGKFRAKGDLLREWRLSHAMPEGGSEVISWSGAVVQAMQEQDPALLRKLTAVSADEFGKLLGAEERMGGPPPLTRAMVSLWENGENLPSIRKYHAMIGRIYDHMPREALELLRTAPEHECFARKGVAVPSAETPQTYVSAEDQREQLRLRAQFEGRTDF